MGTHSIPRRYGPNGFGRAAPGLAAARGVLVPALLSVFFAFACASSDDARVEPAERRGRWWDGDLHVHTNASNDAKSTSTPEAIRDKALAIGLDFVVLTDHSNSTGSFEHCAPGANPMTCIEDPSLFNLGPEFPHWEEASRLTEPGRFLMVDGNEISPVTELGHPFQPTGHLGCIPVDLETFGGTAPSFAFTDRPMGAVTGGANVAPGHSIGCWMVANHPYAPVVGSWTAYDWTSREYDALEIWNAGAGLDFSEKAALLAWLCDLSQARSTVAVGTSDCHDVREEPGDLLHPSLGMARTAVWAETLAWPAIIEGLKAGRVVVHDAGAFLDLRVERRGRDIGGIGDRIPARRSERLVFRLSGRSAVPAEVVLAHVVEGSCSDQRTPGRISGVAIPIVEDFIGAVPGENEPFDLEARVEVAPGALYFARTRHEMGPLLAQDLAITNAVGITR